MIIVIHGNGLSATSKKLSEIKKQFDPLSTQEFSGKQVEFDQAVINFATGGLFSEQRLVVLEEYDPSTSSGQAIDLDKLPTVPDTTVVLKFNKSLTAASPLLKKAISLKAQVFSFSEAEETNIFPFLDGLADKNPKVLDQLDKLLSEMGGQYLLTMIFYMLRRMVQDPKKLPPFVQQKIQKQKQNFPVEKIAELYQAGLETDFKLKSGLIEEKIGMTLLVNKILTQ